MKKKKILIFPPSVLANSKLPVAEIFVLAGFILIYLVEEFGHWALVRWGNTPTKHYLQDQPYSSRQNIFFRTKHILQNKTYSSGQNTFFRTGHLSGEGDAHGHSHEIAIPVEESIQATARGFLVVLALSIHDFFEGIALGVGSTA